MSALFSILPAATPFSKPDIFEWRLRSNSLPEVPKNFVISRDTDGNPLSLAEDMSWRLGTYDNRTRSYKKINFISKSYSNDMNLICQVQWILFLLMYTREGGPSGAGISVGTLQAYHRTLGKMSIFCESKEVDIFYLFNTPETLVEFGETIHSKEDQSRLYTLADHLSTLDSELLGFEALSPPTYSQKRCYDDNDNQTAVIPPRIFLSGLSCLKNRLSDFLEHSKKISYFLIEVEDYFYSSPHENARSQWSPDFVRSRAEEHGLDILFKKNHVFCIASLGRYLRSIQFASKCTIHAFSGMRDDEAYSLRYNCLTTKKINNKKVLQLLGITTKLSRCKKSTYWITSPQVKIAITAAQLICKIVSHRKNVSLDSLLLFPNLSNLKFHTAHTRFQGDINTPANLVHWHMNYIFNHVDMVITHEDYTNLTSLDFQKKWATDERFQINKRWHFTTHQFRRSLAFYAIQSNLVTYTSLKRQLQHLSRAMTLYYARGRNKFSELFGSDMNHFKTEYQSMAKFVEALNYESDFISNDIKLYGGHGAWVEANRTSTNPVNIIASDSETAKSAIYQGKMAYRGTIHGGCTSITACDRVMHAPLTSCLRCAGAVIKKEKTENVIRAQRIFLNTLAVGSPEYLTELEDLLELEKFLSSILNKEIEKC